MFSLFQRRVLRKVSYKELSHLGQKQLLERPELLQENTKMILYIHAGVLEDVLYSNGYCLLGWIVIYRDIIG